MRGGKETQYAIGKTLAVMLVKNEVITICLKIRGGLSVYDQSAT